MARMAGGNCTRGETVTVNGIVAVGMGVWSAVGLFVLPGVGCGVAVRTGVLVWGGAVRTEDGVAVAPPTERSWVAVLGTVGDGGDAGRGDSQATSRIRAEREIRRSALRARCRCSNCLAPAMNVSSLCLYWPDTEYSTFVADCHARRGRTHTPSERGAVRPGGAKTQRGSTGVCPYMSSVIPS